MLLIASSTVLKQNDMIHINLNKTIAMAISASRLAVSFACLPKNDTVSVIRRRRRSYRAGRDGVYL